ncbi:MAG: hypothetical protein GX310_08195 [Synergistaceae bacterium]|nr:hypothetical protein [Synergistaceae bacterium]
MANLQIKDCPDDVYERLQTAARVAGRSVAEQALLFLERGIEERGAGAERRRILIHRLRSREPNSSLQELDAVALIREDRDA